MLADFGSMIGFGLGSPTKDFVVGAAWCPRSSPVGLQLGWHIALRDYPPDGTDMTKPITDPTVTLKQKRLNGVTAGVVFTTDFFAKTFGAVFKP